jgi:curved DNA-binding protein CbpA
MMENLYHILGVPENAGDEEIKKAFRMLAKQYHPDISKGDSDRFRKISHSYKILSNRESRKDYDKTLRNFNRKRGEFGTYTKDSYSVEGKHLKNLLKEIINQGHFTDIKISYKEKHLFTISFPMAVALMTLGLIKAPIAFLLTQIGFSAFFKIEVTNQLADMYGRAIEYHSVGRITEAEYLYKEILERSEYFIPALLNLGILYRQRGNDKKAVQCFRQVLEITPYGDIGDMARKNLAEIRGF